MKKFITTLIILIISTTPVFSKSIFQKQEEIQTDRTAPFFINIYAESDDVNSDFEELRLNYTPQVEILSKGFDIPALTEESDLFVTAKKSAGVDLFKLQIESVEFMTNYK